MNTAQAVPLVVSIPIAQLVESPTNPRKIFGDLTELTASVTTKGIISPLLARKKGKAFELVFGHRRLRAAKLAGLVDVPVMVRELDDLEALEMQLVENSQREDIHPLEEAEGYIVLHETHGYTVDEIAAKVGKSRASVYGRIKLAALCPKAREMFAAGELTPSTALLVARIPSPKLQVEAAKAIGGSDDVSPMSAREASREIENRFMLRLVDAKFDVTSAELVPEAGACSACPKRTGNQAELFADVASADVCTDPPCFHNKVDAEWKRRAAAAKMGGQTVIPVKDGKKFFPWGAQLSSSSHVDLDAKNYDDPKHRTYRELLKKVAPESKEITLVRDGDGGIHELVTKSKAASLVKKAGHNFKKEAPTMSSYGAQNKKEAEKRKAERAAEDAALKKTLAKISAKAELGEPALAFWIELIVEEASSSWFDGIASVLERRGVESENQNAEELLRLELEKMSLPQLRAILIELAAASSDVVLKAACRAYGIKHTAA